MAEDDNRRLLRARDTIDRHFAEPLDLERLCRVACMSEAHFIRSFRAAFGETPHRYLQRRRIERAMFLLRTTETSITDICFLVGYGSLGTFSRTFADVVGESPTAFRARGALPTVPTCFIKQWTRPSSIAQERRSGA
jgi:AraC-like DNA-binding protein